jgi:hypothetical protein
MPFQCFKLPQLFCIGTALVVASSLWLVRREFRFYSIGAAAGGMPQRAAQTRECPHHTTAVPRRVLSS